MVIQVERVSLKQFNALIALGYIVIIKGGRKCAQ